jgi:uncharacterized BrkB/YihY/UPF0761 family membrane protein
VAQWWQQQGSREPGVGSQLLGLLLLLLGSLVLLLLLLLLLLGSLLGQPWVLPCRAVPQGRHQVLLLAEQQPVLAGQLAGLLLA